MSKLLVTAGWDHAPHLDEDTKQRLLAAYPPHERDARTKGVPRLGSGLVFPVDEEMIKIRPIQIPAFWARIGGLDFGWDHPTAATQLAWDKDADVIYVISEFRQREATPLMVAGALRNWGTWLPFAWPHDGLQHDKGSGQQLANQYKAQGIKMLQDNATFDDGSNGVEAGITDMLTRMQTGRWKVFSTCQMWLEEYRMYHRKDGLIVKMNDDVICSSRYAFMMRRHAKVPQIQQQRPRTTFNQQDSGMGMLG